MSIIHCVDSGYTGGVNAGGVNAGGVNAGEQARLQRARNSWEHLYGLGLVRPLSLTGLGRSGLGFTVDGVTGSVRDVRYVRDLLDIGMSQSTSDSDMLLLSNNDSVLVRETLDYVSSTSWYSHRLDHNRPLRRPLTLEYNMRQGSYSSGIDLICLSVAHWRQLTTLPVGYPDLFMGAEGWDWIFKCLLPPLSDCLVGHELHGVTYWMDHRSTDPCNLHNRSECAKWVAARSDAALIHAFWPTLAGYRILP